MRTRFAYVALFVLTTGFATIACVGDDPATTPMDADGGVTTPPAAEKADGGGDVTPEADGGGPVDDAGDDAGPTVSPRILAYAFSNVPGADSTPSAGFAYSASGGPMSISRTSTGQYTVTFTGLVLDESVALVSGYGMAGGQCIWGSTSGETVQVRCFNAAGSASDAKFVLTVFGKGTAGASILGFAHANDKTSASYTPQASRSNNDVGGGAITALRVSPGTYKMEFAGLALSDIENVQVMPYGDPGAHCIVKSWGGVTVNVDCFDGAGAAADAQYTVLIAGQKAGSTARVVAYANPSSPAAASYAPALAYNEGNGAVTATRSAAGTYSIAFDGRNLNDGAHVQVAAHGQGRRCNVGAWAGTTVDLTCANSAGNTFDNSYGIVVIQ